MTPYTCVIQEAGRVKSGLINLMTVESDMKRFKNIAAVYIVWQDEMQSLQLEELSWKHNRAHEAPGG